MKDTTVKTWGREIAAGLLVFWIGLTFKYFTFTDAALATAMSPSYNTVTLVLVPCCLAMFGLKTVMHKVNENGRDRNVRD